MHGLELEHFGLQQDGLEQIVDAVAGLGGNRHEDVLAAPFLGDDAFLRQLVPDLFRVRAVLVDLVDGDDDRHVGRLGVLDCFLGLRHDAVVGRDDQDDDVGHLRAARAHRGEGGVARRVEEGDDAARRLDVIGADVLRDAARLARGDLGAADVVEQRRLAVVDVAHDRDDRRTRQRLFGGVHAGLQRFFDLVGLQHLGDVAHLLDHEHGRVLVHRLVDRGHDAHVEHRLHDFARLDGHALGELGDRDGLADRDFVLHRLGRQLEAVLAVRADARPRGGAARAASGPSCAARTARRRCAVPGARSACSCRPRRSCAPFPRARAAPSPPARAPSARPRGASVPRPGASSPPRPCGARSPRVRGAAVRAALPRARSALGGYALRVLGFALLVERFLRNARLLLEHVALDVGALAAHFDADGARLADRRGDLDLALRLAAQRDLARRAAVLGLAVRLAQVGQELVLRILADAVLRAERRDAGFLELRQQLVDRDLQDLGELLDRDVGHLYLPPSGLRPDPRFRTGARAQP